MKACCMGGMVMLAMAGAVLSVTGATEQPLSELQDETAERVESGLLALYDFTEPSGAIVRDRSGVRPPVDLQIANLKQVKRTAGALQVRGATIVRSVKEATRISQAIRRSGALTVEAWVRPQRLEQSGPARMVTISRSANERNFTLGQDGDRIDARLRTTETSTNGIPSLPSPERTVTRAITHVVYTRHKSGRAVVYVNGKKVVERNVGGGTGNWAPPYRLALANELSGDRPWLGTFYLVAVYGRDLSSSEVATNFRAGHTAAAGQALAVNLKARTFEEQVAPLLANHCLECHDPATREGGLDLASRRAAFAGGENGPTIVAAKSEESLLWQYVESDEMPKDRPPLSPRQKDLLRQWIDDGATWSIDTIDPVVYAHSGAAGRNWVRRLTIGEYIETVRAATGVDIAADARRLLPPDLRADGFSNTAYNLNVDLKHVDAYAELASLITDRMDVLKFARRFSSSRQLTDKSMRGLISKMGKWLLRGPLQEHEVVAFRGVSTTVASAGGNFEEAARFTIEAMLQSPRFIYRVENQRGDGTAWPVGDYELASRLSYLVWGGPPDEILFKAAESGGLDAAGVRKQLQRMLQDPRAIGRSREFASEWLNLDRLANLQPGSERFPEWDPVLAADMQQETLQFFEDVVWKQKRPLADLLNAQFTWATPRLARHYGLPPAADSASPEDVTRYDLSDVPGRGGLLTQGSVLTIGGDQASMVSRGLFVLHDLLRGTVKDPPPCVDTRPIPTKRGLTQRGIAETRIANNACGGCHSRFEPLAFGLEKFDGLGTWRDADEHGNPLREDGRILFPGAAEPVSYQTAAELMDLMARSERVQESLTWKVAQFSLGRPLGPPDVPSLERVHKASQKGGGTWESLITAIVMSDLVQMTRTETEAEPAGAR